MVRRTAAALLLASSVLLPRLAAQCGTWETRFNAPGMNNDVYALLSWDDGNGSALYAGGDFTRAGHVNAQRVARWRGGQWSTLGGGLPARVLDLCVWDDGGGEKLVASTTSA